MDDSRPAVKPPVAGSLNGSLAVSPTVAARTRVTRAGTTMAPVVTAAASPTMALGLRRMVLKAPSKKSPSVSGRSATTPGLCTGGPQGGVGP